MASALRAGNCLTRLDELQVSRIKVHADPEEPQVTYGSILNPDLRADEGSVMMARRGNALP
jgi:hypothetical protein